MASLKVVLLGGTGFVGHTLAARLVALGHQVRVLARHAQRHREFLVLPTAQLIEADVLDPAILRREFLGADAVINLVGILNAHSEAGFDHVHVELPRKIVDACRQSGVQRLLHMSALGASADGLSRYQRSKAAGEAIVRGATDLATTVFRPSVIFGPRDNFTNRFAHLLRRIPLAFPLACPGARLQPVYVDDVAHAYVAALTDHRSFGRAYDLCGPRVYTLSEILSYINELIGTHRRILRMNDTLARAQAGVFDLLYTLRLVHEPPFSLDNYRSLARDNVCEHGFPVELAAHPASLEQILPTYLARR